MTSVHDCQSMRSCSGILALYTVLATAPSASAPDSRVPLPPLALDAFRWVSLPVNLLCVGDILVPPELSLHRARFPPLMLLVRAAAAVPPPSSLQMKGASNSTVRP